MKRIVYILGACILCSTMTTCFDDEQQNIEQLIVREQVKAPSINKPAPFFDSIPADVAAYIERYAVTAQQEMIKYSIPASIKLGQAILESGYGRSNLARKANNHFGIKCRSFGGLPIGDLIEGCIEHPDASSTGVWTTARFLSFESVWASYRAHSIVLSGSRYSDLQNYGRDYKKWAYGLYERGYAADPSYAQKLISVIEAYKLYTYDSLT